MTPKEIENALKPIAEKGEQQGKELLGSLSKITGIKKPDMDSIFKEVKANRALLESCQLHDFSIPHRTVGSLVRDYRCSKCGGHVDVLAKMWYDRGLEHAKAHQC